MPTSVSPCCSISGTGRRQQAARGREDRLRLRGRARQRVRARRAREVVEAQPQHDGAADPAARRACGASRGRRARPAWRRSPPATSASGRARAASRSSGGGGRRAPAAGRGCARARAGGGPSRARASTTSASSPSSATSPTVVIPRAWSLPAVTTPTPQSRSTGSGWRKASSPSGGTTSRPSGLATPLATLARNFVRATPTVIGRPDPLAHLAPQALGDRHGRPGDPLHPAHVEERLVDREPLDQRRRVVEDAVHRPARLGVGREARLDDDRLRAQPARAPAAHRGADAERLGLVARGEHDPRADDHRPAAQRAGRRAARPTRRTSRRRRAGWWPRATRTYVRITRGEREGRYLRRGGRRAFRGRGNRRGRRVGRPVVVVVVSVGGPSETLSCTVAPLRALPLEGLCATTVSTGSSEATRVTAGLKPCALEIRLGFVDGACRPRSGTSISPLPFETFRRTFAPGRDVLAGRRDPAPRRCRSAGPRRPARS